MAIGGTRKIQLDWNVRSCLTQLISFDGRGGFRLLPKVQLHVSVLVISHLQVVHESLESIFISVFNQLDAQNLFHNKFYFMPLHVSSTCAHHQEVKIVLHNL